jgi:hypothetical protein
MAVRMTGEMIYTEMSMLIRESVTSWNYNRESERANADVNDLIRIDRQTESFVSGGFLKTSCSGRV